MKLIKRLSLFAVLMLSSIYANAYDFKAKNSDGVTIYYNVYSTTCTVTFKSKSYKSYKGNIVIPSTVTYKGNTYTVTGIGKCAFMDCEGLTSITLPEGVTFIGNLAFASCSNLTSITLPNTVKSIDHSAFSSCIGLTSIIIPSSVTEIGDLAFYKCTNLKSITIPEGVTKIESRTFEGCTSLTSITIPNGVTEIGNHAFNGCSSLKSITIQDGVTYIPSNMCGDCTSLEFVTLGKKVERIEPGAFMRCSSLKSFTCHAPVPPTCVIWNRNTMINFTLPKEVFAECILFVPAGSESAYSEAEGWKDFKKIREEIKVKVSEDGSVKVKVF